MVAFLSVLASVLILKQEQVQLYAENLVHEVVKMLQQ